MKSNSKTRGRRGPFHLIKQSDLAGARGSRQQLLNHTSTRLAQLLEPPRVEISQLVIVETEQMENRGVDVLKRVRDFDGFLADFIRRADDVAGFHAAAANHFTWPFALWSRPNCTPPLRMPLSDERLNSPP